VVLSVVVVSSAWVSETESVVPDEQDIKTKHNKVSKNFLIGYQITGIL
tara:strand:- start:379 stop:522 length:144 start_codon:yes stop_codon:yes gene_type:complete